MLSNFAAVLEILLARNPSTQSTSSVPCFPFQATKMSEPLVLLLSPRQHLFQVSVPQWHFVASTSHRSNIDVARYCQDLPSLGDVKDWSPSMPARQRSASQHFCSAFAEVVKLFLKKLGVIFKVHSSTPDRPLLTTSGLTPIETCKTLGPKSLAAAWFNAFQDGCQLLPVKWSIEAEVCGLFHVQSLTIVGSNTDAFLKEAQLRNVLFRKSTLRTSNITQPFWTGGNAGTNSHLAFDRSSHDKHLIPENPWNATSKSIKNGNADEN